MPSGANRAVGHASGRGRNLRQCRQRRSSALADFLGRFPANRRRTCRYRAVHAMRLAEPDQADNGVCPDAPAVFRNVAATLVEDTVLLISELSTTWVAAMLAERLRQTGPSRDAGAWPRQRKSDSSVKAPASILGLSVAADGFSGSVRPSCRGASAAWCRRPSKLGRAAAGCSLCRVSGLRSLALHFALVARPGGDQRAATGAHQVELEAVGDREAKRRTWAPVDAVDRRKPVTALPWPLRASARWRAGA